MGALAIAVIVFLAVGAASLVGIVLGQRLPAGQLDGQSRDTVRLVAAFLSTLSALVLGLMIAAAKSNYDERSGQLRRIAADVVALDRALGRYGVDAREIRDQLRAALIDELQHRTVAESNEDGSLARPVRDTRLLGLPDRIQALAVQSEGQRSARYRAGQLADGIAATRVLMTQDPGGSIPPAFLGARLGNEFTRWDERRSLGRRVRRLWAQCPAFASLRRLWAVQIIAHSPRT